MGVAMGRWSIAVAGFVVGVAFFASPALPEDLVGAPPDITAAPEYSVTPPRDFPDVKLAAGGVNPSVAVNPKNPNVFVAAYAAGGFCWVRTSSNAGQTWNIAKRLPMLGGKLNCDTTALFWAPDGSRVYAAYNYLIGDTFDPQEAGAFVSFSKDKGLTWSSPKIALRYPYESYRIVSLRLSTPLRASDAKWVYLLSETLTPVSSHTNFTRSADQGQTWRPAEVDLVASYYTSTTPSIAGGLGGEILVAWGEFHYDVDGPLLDRQIFVKHSNNYGATFSADITAVPDIFGDAAVAFGSGGTAHLIYTREWYGDDFYNGKPSYVYSTKAPYTAWSQPVVLSDDISASSYRTPALTVSACGSGASVLHAVWLDDRAGSENYSVYYTRKVAKTGEDWSPNLRVSGTLPVDSTGYPLFAPAIAAGMGTAVGLWGQLWGYYLPDPVWASRIAPGVSCP